MLAGDTEELQKRSVVLTFDDGYEDFHSRAMPLPERYGFTATVFVTTDWVEDAGPPVAGKRPGHMLSWSQIAEAAHLSIEVGTHSRKHPQLAQPPDKLLREEPHTSKAQIEDELGSTVAGLAYPFGYSHARVRQVARDAGHRYRCVVGNIVTHSTSDVFASPRLTIRSSTPIAAFRQVASGRFSMMMMMMMRVRVLTKGWAMIRRARAMSYEL